MKLTRSAAGAATLIALCLTALTSCGDSGSDDTPTNKASRAPSGAPSMDSSQLAAIQKCLDAAGIDTQMPSGAPSDMPTDMPTDMPSDMPTDMPSNLPSGMAGGGAGMNNPEVQAALKACGIDMPSAPGGQ